MDGTIKNINHEKLYGFIIVEGGNQYFFHKQDLVNSHDFDSLERGSPVNFDPQETPKGPRATTVIVG